jgi:FkbM family methyltransferase
MKLRSVAWHAYRTLGAALRRHESSLSRFPGPWHTVIDYLGYSIRRFVFTPAAHSVSTVDGFRLCFDRSDVDAPEFLLGTYEETTTRLFKRLVKPGMVVVDLGAHIGWYTLLAARSVGETGRVYAFEPSQANFLFLLRNLDLNGIHNVIPVRKAVSNTTGPMTLFLGQHGRTGLNTLYPNRFTGGDVVTIEAITLDDFFEKEGWPRIDLVKMDIEGAEPAALEGMTRLIQKMDSMKLIVEFFPTTLQAAGASPQQFLERLLGLGLSVQVINEKLEPLDVHRLIAQLSSGPLVANLLCEKESL